MAWRSAHQRTSAPAQAEAGETGPADVAKMGVDRLLLCRKHFLETALILPETFLEEMQRRSEGEGIFRKALPWNTFTSKVSYTLYPFHRCRY